MNQVTITITETEHGSVIVKTQLTGNPASICVRVADRLLSHLPLRESSPITPATGENAMSMKTIETLAEQYAKQRHALADLVNQINEEQRAIILRQLRSLRLAMAETAAAEDALRNAIEAEPQLFEKPRTRVLHGVKVGYQKGKGKVEIDDEAKTIRYIREKLPTDQAELMIRVTEKVERRAVMDLTASDLKRLGIRIVESGDQVVIKPVDSQVDRLIKALLADLPNEGEEAA